MRSNISFNMLQYRCITVFPENRFDIYKALCYDTTGVRNMAYVEEGAAGKKFVCSNEKPNIFLIGDSIRGGYCAEVKSRLADYAEVFYLNDNCRSTQFVIFSLNAWGNLFDCREKVNLVLFNCGHWDIAHWLGSEESLTGKEEYKKNLRMITALLRKIFVNAKLVFATTTPMNPSGVVGVNPRTSKEIDAYNCLAAEVFADLGVDVLDLNGFCRDWDSTFYRDYCHFTEAGYARLADEIVSRIRGYL